VLILPFTHPRPPQHSIGTETGVVTSVTLSPTQIEVEFQDAFAVFSVYNIFDVSSGPVFIGGVTYRLSHLTAGDAVRVIFFSGLPPVEATQSITVLERVTS